MTEEIIINKVLILAGCYLIHFRGHLRKLSFLHPDRNMASRRFPRMEKKFLDFIVYNSDVYWMDVEAKSIMEKNNQ